MPLAEKRANINRVIDNVKSRTIDNKAHNIVDIIRPRTVNYWVHLMPSCARDPDNPQLGKIFIPEFLFVIMHMYSYQRAFIAAKLQA